MVIRIELYSILLIVDCLKIAEGSSIYTGNGKIIVIFRTNEWMNKNWDWNVVSIVHYALMVRVLQFRSFDIIIKISLISCLSDAVLYTCLELVFENRLDRPAARIENVDIINASVVFLYTFIC